MDHASEASALSLREAVERRFDQPPKRAIEYFKAKNTVRKREFEKLTTEARAAAFTVGGVYQNDVLEGFKDELRRSLEQGRTQAATVKRFREILSGAGHRQLGEFHLETVFRTNMQTAYGVGRRNHLEQVKDVLPWWTYHAVGDDRTRPTHEALTGITLPADNEFWSTHFPPWGFNCRCSVTAAAELPDSYDPRNPSGRRDDYGEPLVQVSYDANGVPAKAEYGTTLYDLQVGNFSGIPPFATLKTAIEAGAARAARKK
jgi:SPP1 gp7 family putative phage head morphogenesis protein